jgi:hypothetical protein
MAPLSVLDSATTENAICGVVSVCSFVLGLRLVRRQTPAELVLTNQTHLEVLDDQKKYLGGNWRGSCLPVSKQQSDGPRRKSCRQTSESCDLDGSA